MRILVVSFIVLACSAASAPAEDFHVEFTGSYWRLKPSGNVQTSSTRVDLRSDLGIQEHRNQTAFKVVVKPGHKHRINFEVIPYRFKGQNNVSRVFQLGGISYPVQDRITSEAGVNYLFGSYPHDFVDKQEGHAGVIGGLAYFDAKASATSQTLGSTGREERKLPLPLIGGEFRAFLIPGKQVFNVNGEVKGMSLGSFGRYIHATGNAGVAAGRNVRLQAGFNFVDADVHNQDRTKGFKLHFNGPIFSVQLDD